MTVRIAITPTSGGILDRLQEERMKYFTVILVLAVAFFPVNTFASCPDVHPEIFGPGTGTTLFSFDTSCASTSGDVSGTTMSCYSWAGHQWDLGSGSVDYSMTVPSGYGGPHFSVSIYVDFSDPGSYSSNSISATVIVWHNGSPSSNSFFFHNGTQGSMGCDLVGSGYFSAADGDTIEVSMTGTKYSSGATMKIAPPYIFAD
jgi:hypothetical protein